MADATKYVSSANLGSFKAKQDAYNDGRFAKKGDIAAVMRFKGSCAFAGLPADAEVGDTWNVTDRGGMNYAWTGEGWDELGSTVELSWDAIEGKPELSEKGHKHTVADITDLPVQQALSVSLGDGEPVSYDGSAAVSVEVTPAAIGAAEADHDHAAMAGATDVAAGKAGFVPAPASGKQGSYLRGDGTWAVPENTTYADMEPASQAAAGARGLVPAPGAGKQASYLRGDGTWSVPTDTTYSPATGEAAGLMSAADKAKLDAIEPGASAVSPMTDAEIDALFA